MKKLTYLFVFIVSFFIVIQLTSCKKELLFSKNHLEFSADTVMFDTVFTTVGSTTKRLKIYNKENRSLKINSVRLSGGEDSPFRINLDGVSGVLFKDIVIPEKDSLFMFVEVTLGENNDANPLVIEDEVIFETNGKFQKVLLVAWGQDAYFHYQDSNEGIWPNDKPHVIYGYTVVDSLKTLTIQAGTQVYLHKGAILYVNSGTLIVDGDYDNKVVFQGDRLESFYKDVKGQYYGIYFNLAQSSKINNAIIKNGTAGIHVYGDHPSNSDYTLEITNTEIYNHSSYGIFNYSGGKIKGENLSVYDNGIYAYFLLEGGSHNFRHSQFLSYGSDGQHPAVAIKNYFTRNDGITYIGQVEEGSFYNSIIYGPGDIQIAYDTLTENGTVPVNFDYNTNFIKQTEVLIHSGFKDNFWNTDPKFENINSKIYKITESSLCIDNGKSEFVTLPRDIEGNSREMGKPDIGAYEYN